MYFLYNIVLVSLYIKMNQLHIYTYPHSFGFPFHLDHQKMIAQGTQPLFFLIFYSLFSTSRSTFFGIFPQVLEVMSITFQFIFRSNLLIILPSAIYCQSMWFSNNLFSISTNRTRFLKTIIQWFQYLCHLSVVFCWLLFLFWGLPGLWSDKGFSTVFRHLSFYILRPRMLLDSFINQASLTAM